MSKDQDIRDPKDLTVAIAALPCPFCRSREVLAWFSNDAAPGVWCVFCMECEAEGPHEASQDAATKSWNTRAD